MIYYSVLYPPLLPITIPAFELNRNEQGEEDFNARWRLYFEPSIGNKISEFKGGFIRVRKAEAETSILQGANSGYLLDLIPFRNPFAEYTDPYTQEVEGQPEGYPLGMPAVHLDATNNSYYIDVPHKIFQGESDIRYKVQIMLTKDWLSAETDDGEGVISAWNEDLGDYQAISKTLYFGGNLVQKGLSEWSRVTIVSPVSEAKYEIVFEYVNINANDDPVGYLNSPILELVGQRIVDTLPTGLDGNALQAYRIEIFNNAEYKPTTKVDDSGWIVGQENENIEIRWQNEVELENKTYYWIKLEIQTIWDLRKEFWVLCYSDFEASLFQGKVRAVNDHEKARVKIIISAKSPLTWGPRHALEIDPYNDGFVRVKDSVESKDFRVEQGIDLTTKNGSFAGEMIVTNVKPIQDWEEDDTKFFFRMKGPELSVHNPYQEEYLLYAHSAPISDTVEYEVYEEDVIINPILKGPNGISVEAYMSPTGHIDYYSINEEEFGNPEVGGLATGETDAPVSHPFILLLDDEERAWRVSVSADGTFNTVRAYEYQDQEVSEFTPVYLYDKHNRFIKRLTIGTDGVLQLTGRAIHFDRAKAVKPMYINEFRLVKKVWGLQLGRKVLIGKQTYKAFMNDFNRKLGDWSQINPGHHYYIYFASVKGQLFLYIRDLTAQMLGKNFIDRYNLNYGIGGGTSLPESGLFLTTNGIDTNYVPIRDDNGNYIKYVISVDEKGSLVSDIAYIGTSTTTQKSMSIVDNE